MQGVMLKVSNKKESFKSNIKKEDIFILVWTVSRVTSSSTYRKQIMFSWHNYGVPWN